MTWRLGYRMVSITVLTATALLTSLLVHAQQRRSIDPPPGNAATLTLAQARTMLEDSLKKRFVGTIKERLTWHGDERMTLSEVTDIHVRITGFAFSTSYRDEIGRIKGSYNLSVNADFRTKVKSAGTGCSYGRGEDNLAGYLNVVRFERAISPPTIYSLAYAADPHHLEAIIPCALNDYIFAWTDAADA